MGASDRPSVLVDGRVATVVPVTDRGLQYADGLFETIRMHEGRAPLWRRHMARLAQGAERLGLPAPEPDLLAQECAQVSAGLPAAVCKIIYTRGSGGQAYTPPQTPVPLRIVISREAPVLSADGLAVTFCQTRLATSPSLAGLKHCGRLEQGLARRELVDSGFDEGLMCDAGGQVIEATSANLFVLRNDILYTPDLANAGVAGVMRELVMERLVAEGCPVREEALSPEDCRQAQALFLCNAVRGIMPVTRLEVQNLEVPPLVRKLARDIAALLDGGVGRGA